MFLVMEKLNKKMSNDNKIIVYSAKLCSDCQKLKGFLESHNIEYENRDIRDNPKWGEELEAKTGKLGVPYLLIDGEWIIGYEANVGYSEEWAKKTLEKYI
jgi:glutaredoxin-like protein NrdH